MTMKSKITDWFGRTFGTFPSFEEACPKSFNKVILPIIRRVMPAIIAQDIIGVQPMTGPSMSIAALRTRYADSLEDKDENEDDPYSMKIKYKDDDETDS